MSKKNDSVFKPIGFSYSEKRISKNFQYPSDKISLYTRYIDYCIWQEDTKLRI